MKIPVSSHYQQCYFGMEYKDTNGRHRIAMLILIPHEQI